MYFKDSHNTGQEKFHKKFTVLTHRIHTQFYYCYPEALIKGICLLFLLTLAYGCSESVDYVEETQLDITSPYFTSSVRFNAVNALDILVFNDDRLQRLDSYQKIKGFTGDMVHATSTGGQKIFFLYYGPSKERYEWADINSYGALRKVICNLEEEDRDNPVMTGHCRLDAGLVQGSVTLTPLASEVWLNSLRFDFSGTPYAGRPVSETKAYLINVNASCSITADSGSGGMRMINTGMLNPDDMNGFADRSILMHTFGEDFHTQTAHPEKSFLCYPNGGDTGMLTKLVIEGKIDGITYYWPISVGKEGGIARSSSYRYDILIRRKGVSDPDSLIEPEIIEIDLSIKPWNEKENYPVRF